MKLISWLHRKLLAVYTSIIRKRIHCKGKLILSGLIEIESGERIYAGDYFQPRKGVSLCAMKERKHNYDTRIQIGDHVILNYRTCVWATDSISIGNGENHFTLNPMDSVGGLICILF